MDGNASSIEDMARTAGVEPGAAPSLATAPGAAPGAGSDVATAGLVKESLSMSVLSAHIEVVFDEARRHRERTGVDRLLDELLRMSLGRYTTAELIEIAGTGAQPIYIPVADKKHRAAAAMLGELFNNPGDKPWTLSPTPDPTVPKWVMERAAAEVVEPMARLWAAEHGGAPPPVEEVRAAVLRRMDEIDGRRRDFARKACRRMEERIHDQMVEGGWIEAFNQYVDDLCVYGTGILRGPEPRVRRVPAYEEGRSGGAGTVRMREQVALEFEAISPFDVFPAPGARDIDDGPLVVRVRYLPEELALAAGLSERKDGVKGWIPDAVRSVLRAAPQGGVRDWGSEVARPADPKDDPEGPKQDTSADSPTANCTIDGLEYFGTALGSELLGIGLSEQTDGRPIDADAFYEIDAIRLDRVIVYCRIVEPEIGRPICKGVFYQRSDSWWGVGPMEKCYAAQKMCNAAVRNLAVNMAQAAGPQFAVTDMNRLLPDCGTDLTPWKVWTFGPPPFGQGGNANPIQMFQPESNAGELLRVEEYFDKMCDELSGVPAYTMGQGVGGEIGRTASGYSMLMESATRGFKHAVYQTDVGVIRKTVMRCYAWNMLHGRDPALKGDVRCNPAGMMGQINKEQDYNRKMQFLQLTNNPTDMQIVGLGGRAALLREIARPMEMPLDDVLRSPEKLEEEQRLAELRQRLDLAERGAQLPALPAPGGGEPPAEPGTEEGGESAFRGASGGRRATIPGAGTGITPQARGAMRRSAVAPRERAMQGLRAAQTRSARRAVA